MNAFSNLLIAVVFSLAVTAPCQSAEVSTRTALIIGIGVYDRPEIPALAGVKEDMVSAMAIATVTRQNLSSF